MARHARVVAEAVPHHVAQQGNNRQDIFLADDDRLFYLVILREKSQLFGLSLLGYCLTTSHVHVSLSHAAPTRSPRPSDKATGATAADSEILRTGLTFQDELRGDMIRL